MQRPKTFDPRANYIAPVREWSVLQTLAQSAVPSAAVTAGRWSSIYFASEGTVEAFIAVAGASVPFLLTVPAGLAEQVTPLSAEELVACREQLASWAQVRALARIEHNLVRAARDAAARADASTVRAALESARADLADVAALGRSGSAEIIATLAELTAGYWLRVAERRDAMPTGLAGLDRALNGGLQSRRLYALLGGPGSGKTTLANQIAEHIANAGRPVVYVTSEEPPDILLAKTVTRLGGLSYGAVLHGHESERGRIQEALDLLLQRQSARSLLYMEVGAAFSLEEVRVRVQSHFARHEGGGRGLVVFDYLQRLARAMREREGSGRDLRELVSWLTEQLRDLARELDSAILAISSQSRAAGYGSNGNALASAKESGDIEYTADFLAVLGESDGKRVAPINQEARVLNIVKNRLGESTQLDLNWYGARQHWTEVRRV